MNDEIKEILDRLNNIPMGELYACCLEDSECKIISDYITNLQQENERLNTELNAYKDEFCKDTIKKYELVMEQEYYKSNCEKAIEFIKENTKVIPFNEIGEGGGLELTDYDIPKLLKILGGD